MSNNEVHWEPKPSSIPAIEVRVWMKESQYGGRRSHFTAGYRPHLVVKGKVTYWGIQVLAVSHSPWSGAVFPGDEARIVCGLMAYTKEFNYEELKRGATFEMREGSRVVGTGIVLSDFEW